MASGKVKFRLQGHEKFPLREGWLNKGLKAIQEDKYVFSNGEATDELGIGSNMVKSLRFWMKAFNLIDDSNSKEGIKLSKLGQTIYSSDKYLKKDFTLWLLQSQIVKNAEIATSWFLYFNRCDSVNLTKEQIFNILKRELTEYTNGEKFSEKSLQNDIDVIVNMYSKDSKIEDPEEKNVSPFVHLGLVRKTEEGFEKSHPDIRKLSEWNILYELSAMMSGRNQISIDEAFYTDNGIINIYQITAVQANEYLDMLESMGYIRVNRTAGLDMIYKINDEMKPENIIRDYYAQ